VAGLDTPQAGTLLFDGAPIKGPDYKRGLVFQSPTLFEWLNVHDNIAFGLRARGVYKKDKAAAEAQIAHYIKLMGLEGFEKSYPYQISGGMASRCALARTFIQDPELILLDEPLSALDAFTRMVIQDEIVRMHEQTDAMFLLVTHDIEEAVYLCDRIIVMSARPGRVIAEIDIDLPHPRDRVSAEFIDARRQVLEAFEQPTNVSSTLENDIKEVQSEI
jgi:sulfonate transport system ATP-binding protein